MIAELLARRQQFTPSQYQGGGGYGTAPELIQQMRTPQGAQTMSLGQRMPSGGFPQTGAGMGMAGGGALPTLPMQAAPQAQANMTRRMPQGLPPMMNLMQNPRLLALIAQLRGGGQRPSQGLGTMQSGGY